MGLFNDLLNTAQTPASRINTGGSTGGTGSFNSGLDLLNQNYPQTFIFNLAVILIWALGIAAVGTIIFGGVRYITAGGDSEKAESAKKIIIGSLIGLFLIMASFLIFNTAVSALSRPDPLSNPGEAQQIFNQTYSVTP
jgi:hypothetical protein